MKKDALWKPLLRTFRTYIRASLRLFVDVDQIYNSQGDLNEKASESFAQFIKSSGAPQSVAQNKMNHYSLAIMVAPSSTNNLEKFFQAVPDLSSELATLKPIFSRIFRENSIKLRMQFFANELIRHLWAQFINEKSKEVRKFFKNLKKTSPYLGQVEVLLSDVLMLQQALNCQLIKPEHLQ